jgi:2-polyprenyl-3-methyl-5-hydroxy-6-metoxy-1,4-benzoquinol methylase
VNRLAGLHGHLAVGGLHDQRSAQYDRELVKLRALPGLRPARRAAHMGDAQAGLARACPPHVLVDQLRWLAGRRHPARLADQFRHAGQYSAGRYAPAGTPGIVRRVVTEDPREVVRRGYDALSVRYEQWGGETKYRPWLSELRERIPAGGAVLDLGCGSGLPVARDLAAVGYRVTGVDISEVQIRRARELVPQAEFVRADVTAIDFTPASFDAVICLFVLIHLPLEDQPPLLAGIASWLRPGGLFVATTGYRAWTGVDENWLGGGVPMWWSQADAATYRSWITQAGLSIEREEFAPEGDTGHALFWASRPARPGPVGQPRKPASGRPRGGG